jgi:predicted small lipoprotein YifL
LLLCDLKERFSVRQHCARLLIRLAALAALAGALALAGCGRKGPLDPPPAASLAGAQPAQTSAGIDSGGRSHAAPGPNRHIPLDVLLN